MRTNYLSIDAILDLQKAFNGHMEVSNIDLQKSPVREIRTAMFDYFQQPAFLDSYMHVARKAADSVGLLHNDLVLQSVPTPRIFRPQAHGTSFHSIRRNRYWSRHGRQRRPCAAAVLPPRAIQVNTFCCGRLTAIVWMTLCATLLCFSV
jgi:hypothetical protein